jgi:predicted Zn-dependent peptidase
MVLSIAGNFDVETVLAVADRMLKPDEKPVEIRRKAVDEPEEICKPLVEQKLAVAAPLFQFGFKGKSSGVSENLKSQVLDEILCDIIAGEATPLYRKMYDSGIINATFSTEVMRAAIICAQFFRGIPRT